MSRAAFETHYREHYHAVRSFCRRMLGTSHDAEDAAQEVFMRAYRAFGRYRPRDPFGPWVRTIAANYCLDVLRGRRRLSEVFDDTDTSEPVDPAGNGATLLISAYEAEAISGAVQSLPEKYRLPIVLAYYADATYDEIAGTLGITRNHVGVLLLRGKEQLRRRLNQLHEESRR
jgi:RNA polymerase sigma-70 factor (ECF subfamily)